MSDLPGADNWTQEQYRKLQPRWLPMGLIASGFLTFLGDAVHPDDRARVSAQLNAPSSFILQPFPECAACRAAR